MACLAIKTSLRLMKKIIEDLEKVDEGLIDKLQKLKLFLGITRLTIEKANVELISCEGGEKSLFLMYFYL